MRFNCATGTQARLSRAIRHGSHEARASRDVPRQGRGDVFGLV